MLGAPSPVVSLWFGPKPITVVRTIVGPSPLRASKVLQWSMSVEDIISVCVAYYRVGGK